MGYRNWGFIVILCHSCLALHCTLLTARSEGAKCNLHFLRFPTYSDVNYTRNIRNPSFSKPTQDEQFVHMPHLSIGLPKKKGPIVMEDKLVGPAKTSGCLSRILTRATWC